MVYPHCLWINLWITSEESGAGRLLPKATFGRSEFEHQKRFGFIALALCKLADPRDACARASVRTFIEVLG